MLVRHRRGKQRSDAPQAVCRRTAAIATEVNIIVTPLAIQKVKGSISTFTGLTLKTAAPANINPSVSYCLLYEGDSERMQGSVRLFS